MRDKYYIESPESERKYRRLAALGRELGVPVPQVFLEMEVTMPDGRVMHHHKQRSHSWVRNAYNMMFSELAAVNLPDSLYAAGKLGIKRTSGAIDGGAIPVTLPQGGVSMLVAGPYGYTAPSADPTAGIVVGYDTATGESFEGYVLINPILEGTTNDGHHLNFILSQPYTLTISGAPQTASAAMTRFMNNNSGGNVTVGEVALYMAGFSAGSQKWCMSRDHLASPVTIPNTGQLKVTYTISLAYPA